MHAGVRCSTLDPLRVINYVSRQPEQGWPEISHSSISYRDEGHVKKVVRALYCLEQLDDTAHDFPLTKAGFLKPAHMAVESSKDAF